MGLQQTVQRAYTGGFAGQLVADGPRRAKPARISSATIGADANHSTNHMSRAFGWSGEIPSGAAGQAPVGVGYVATVAVGTGPFFGILGQPTSYALQGSAGNSLAPTMDLAIGTVGEFFDMATGLMVELFNDTTAAKASAFGDQVAYCSAAGDANGVPLGGLIGVAAGAAAPAGYTLIPNARIMRPLSVPASAAGAAVFALTVIQLTE
jgi:hypothetical protein